MAIVIPDVRVLIIWTMHLAKLILLVKTSTTYKKIALVSARVRKILTTCIRH